MKYKQIINTEKDLLIDYEVIIVPDYQVLLSKSASEIETFLDYQTPKRIVRSHVSQKWGKYIEFEDGEGCYVDELDGYIFYSGVKGGIPYSSIITWYSNNDSLIHVAARQGKMSIWSYGDKFLNRKEIIKAADGNIIFPV